MTDFDPRYPIGRVQRKSHLDPNDRAELIRQIEALPGELRAAISDLAPHEWDLPYRDGGWTIRQVVHHLADSHVNAFVRFRLAVTEETPSIKPYDEAAWANLPDVGSTPPDVSLELVTALHRRIVDLLRALPESAFAREVHHPEHGRNLTVDELITIYAWHGRHHVAHIGQARRRGSGAPIASQPTGAG